MVMMMVVVVMMMMMMMMTTNGAPTPDDGQGSSRSLIRLVLGSPLFVIPPVIYYWT